MKTLKITYKNGKELLEKNVYDYNNEGDCLYISKVADCGIAQVFALKKTNIASVEEI